MKHTLGTLLLLAGVAHADEKLVPTAVAVSSTVDNAKIKPEHLVDGKLDTAWNSVTDDSNPWIAVRIPDGAHVTAIKMTAGFTTIDKKLGDLFIQNIRINAVRVFHDGAWVEDFALDPVNRGLQTLAVSGTDGDWRIDISGTIPGTRKTWREIAVSELEIWGTPAPSAIKATAPLVVRLGGLDNLPILTKGQCAAALGKPASAEVDHDEIAISDALTLCRRDTRGATPIETKIFLALVDRRTPKLLTQLPSLAVWNGENEGGENTGRVWIDWMPLTTTEKALVVHTVANQFDGGHEASSDISTWYRASNTGLKEILSVGSYAQSGDTSARETCTLLPFDVGATLPTLVTFACEFHYDPYYSSGEKPRTEHRTDRYKWNGTEYVKL